MIQAPTNYVSSFKTLSRPDVLPFFAAISASRCHVEEVGWDACRQKTSTNLLSVGAIDAVANRGATFAQLLPSRHDVRDKSVIVHLVAKLLAVVVAASDRHDRKIGMRRVKHPEVQQPSLLDETPHGEDRKSTRLNSSQ